MWQSGGGRFECDGSHKECCRNGDDNDDNDDFDNETEEQQEEEKEDRNDDIHNIDSDDEKAKYQCPNTQQSATYCQSAHHLMRGMDALSEKMQKQSTQVKCKGVTLIKVINDMSFRE